LNEEASVYRFALLGGIVDTSEVIAWADAWIWRLEKNPDALVEVSLNGSRLNELLSALGALAERKLSLEASSMLCRLFLNSLSGRSRDFKPITRLLEHMCIEGALPEPLSAEAHGLDDQLSLAETGGLCWRIR